MTLFSNDDCIEMIILIMLYKIYILVKLTQWQIVLFAKLLNKCLCFPVIPIFCSYSNNAIGNTAPIWQSKDTVFFVNGDNSTVHSLSDQLALHSDMNIILVQKICATIISRNDIIMIICKSSECMPLLGNIQISRTLAWEKFEDFSREFSWAFLTFSRAFMMK